LIIALLAEALITLSPQVNVVAPDLKADWRLRPAEVDLVHCMRQSHAPPAKGSITLHCLTAADDKIDHCTVTSSTFDPDVRYSKAAVCATQFFHIRATGRDAEPVLGAEVTLPVHFSVWWPPL
jgi:hypothetical protein